VEETKDEVVVTVELPGMAKDGIMVQAHGDTLTITGERRREAETKDKTVHLVERGYGRFQRVLGLPAEVDGARAKATYEQGVLTIRLPKSEQAKPKEITVS
jgi:HSP20 family protein